MFTEDKVTELFCMADDFCKFFNNMMAKYTLKSEKKRAYHRNSTISKSKIIPIMILFHDSGCRCQKHLSKEKVCKHLRHLFSKVVSYNHFVELEKEKSPYPWFCSSRKSYHDSQEAKLTGGIVHAKHGHALGSGVAKTVKPRCGKCPPMIFTYHLETGDAALHGIMLMNDWEWFHNLSNTEFPAPVPLYLLRTVLNL